MNSRERLKLVLDRKVPDRVPCLEICFWDETVERWRKEGLPESIVYQSPFLSGREYRDHNTFEDYFGLDPIAFVNYDGSMGFKESLVEENDRFRIYTVSDGITYKAFRDKTCPPVPLDRIIKTRADWEEYKNRLTACRSRFSPDTLELCRTLEKNDIFTIIKPEEPCQNALYLLGEVECLMYMADDPDFIEDIISWFTEFQLNMMEIVLGAGVRLDAIWYFSDLCYKNGMLFSPAFYRERVMKYHRRLFSFMKSRGMQVIYHCDGHISQFLPLLVEAGIDCIQPMEARAGNDVRDYKRLYGDQIAFCGNISADVLATTKEAIEAEIKGKMEIAKKGGGYIFHSDHSIPPGVSLENYRYALDLAREYGRY